jgi:Domain of unknown function (DUF4279)
MNVRFVVLRFYGDDLNPDELTAILGPPTRAYAKGAPVAPNLKPPFLGRTGLWSLSTLTLDLGPDIKVHLAYLWGRVEPHLDELEKLLSDRHVIIELQPTYVKTRTSRTPKRKPLPVSMKPRFERLGVHEMTL